MTPFSEDIEMTPFSWLLALILNLLAPIDPSQGHGGNVVRSDDPVCKTVNGVIVCDFPQPKWSKDEDKP